MGITFLLANDGCRGPPRDDSPKDLNDKLLNKGHASDDIKYIAARCAVVGGGEDPADRWDPLHPPTLECNHA